MQHRIDISSISNRNATEENPITLHYGHHFHQVESQHFRASSSQLTNASAVFDQHSPPTQLKVKQIRSYLTQRDKISIPFVQSSYKQTTNNNQDIGTKSKILSVREIKEAQKRQKIMKRSLSQSGMKGECGSKKEQNLLEGSQGQSHKKKLNLTKYFEYRSKVMIGKE